MGHVDNLFDGEKQINKKRFAEDKFSVKGVASSIIDAKLASEAVYEVSVLIDQRFGHGTWAEILFERKKRIDEEKERKKEIERKKRLAQKERVETFKMIGVVGASAFVAFIIIVFVFVALADEHRNCEDFYKGYVICLSENYEIARGEIYRGKLKRKPKFTNCRLIGQEPMYDRLRQQYVTPAGFKCTFKCPNTDELCYATTGERFNCPRNMDCIYDPGSD